MSETIIHSETFTDSAKSQYASESHQTLLVHVRLDDAWAIVSTLMAVVKDYKGMLACRFVLGITEAPFYPGGVYLISMFYTRKESATRMSIFYTGNLLASSFSGLIAAAVFAGLEGKHGLEGWRWLFIIQGVITGEVSTEAACISH